MKPDPDLLQSDIITKGVSPCEVRRLMPLLQSITTLFFNLLNEFLFSGVHAHALVDFKVPFNSSISFLLIWKILQE